MRNKILSVVMLFSPLFANAQAVLPFGYKTDTTHKHEITTYAGNYIHSTSIPNYFINHFYDGSRFDTTELNRFAERLKREKNRVGIEADYTLDYRYSGKCFKKYPDMGLIFRAGHHIVASAQYTRDLFNLVFRGNSPYAGQTLELAPSGMNFLSYQTMGVGVFSKKKNTSAVVSFVNGQSFYDFALTKGNFYTDSIGQYINFDYSANLSRSDSLRTSFGAHNGWGICTDFYFSFKIPLDSIYEDLSGWFVQINNLGFIRWNQQTLSYAGDSSLYYQGFQANNIFDPGNTFLSGETNLNDTLQIKYTTNRWTQVLPATIIIGNQVDPYTGNRLKPTLGLRYRFVDNYKPMIYAGMVYRLWPNAYTSLNVQAGGFGNWRMGLRVVLPFFFHGSVVIGSSHTLGWFTSEANGKDIYGGLQVHF